MYLKIIFGQTDTDCGKDEEAAPTPTLKQSPEVQLYYIILNLICAFTKFVSRRKIFDLLRKSSNIIQ